MKKKHDIRMWSIPGCLFIGIGLGMIFNQISVGTMIGLGAGFLVVYLFSKKR
jgi:hypothetical protein